jgi:hypothetical protein
MSLLRQSRQRNRQSSHLSPDFDALAVLALRCPLGLRGRGEVPVHLLDSRVHLQFRLGPQGSYNTSGAIALDGFS